MAFTIPEDMKVQRPNRRSVKLICKGPGRTKQAFKKECDVNTIMAKYKKTGLLPRLISREPRYGDFSAAVDYQAAMNTVIFAQEQFAALPAKVRGRFGNDPRQFLEFAENPENAEEMRKMGLMKPQEAPQPATEPASSQQGGAEGSDASKGTGGAS